MTTARQVCHCSHHLSTHHEGGACLGIGCNDCPFFRDDTKPDTLRLKPKRPDHAIHCLCAGCRAYAAAMGAT